MDAAKLSLAQCLVLNNRLADAKLMASQVRPDAGIWLGGFIKPSIILEMA